MIKRIQVSLKYVFTDSNRVFRRVKPDRVSRLQKQAARVFAR